MNELILNDLKVAPVSAVKQVTCPPKPDPCTMLQIRQKETENTEKTTLYN